MDEIKKAVSHLFTFVSNAISFHNYLEIQKRIRSIGKQIKTLIENVAVVSKI